MQGKWVPVRGYVGSGRRLQTCATKENAISAFVLAGSLPHRLSKSRAGACPPPLGNAIISQLSCLLGFFVSSLPNRRDRQFGSFLSEGLGPQTKWVPVRGHVDGGRRLQTCATGENAISAFVLASSLSHRLSKSSAGACPPPLGNAIISQLSCLLGFSVSLLPGRRVRQSASILSKGLGGRSKSGVPCLGFSADAGCKPALPERKPLTRQFPDQQWQVA